MARSTTSEARILAAAKSIFLSDGYSAVTTDQLCREAGVSKTTLYRYFGDMAGVLKAVVKREGDAFSIDEMPLPTTELEFWAALETYGVQLLKLLNTQFCLKLDLTMHEEARQHADIAALFYDNAYGRSHQDVTTLLAHGQAKGYVDASQPAEQLADFLISMWEGLPYVKARLMLLDKPFPQPKRRVKAVLDALFNGRR